MDTKALARSKRAHSLRHTKKNNVHSASKIPSSSSGTGTSNKNPLGEQAGENLQKHHNSRALPSNWDRYGEEFEVGPGDPAGKGSSNPMEFVVPKSRGADYAFLISEAKSQPQLNHSADIFPSFSDFLDDFNQGFGPVLSAKGQSLLSWIAEDDFDFDVEEKPSTSYEAPFLSLDLHALAEQLQKTKLSERLYVDPNVLPPELLNYALHSSGESKDNQTSVSAVGIDSEASSQDHDSEEIKKKNSERLHVPVSTADIVTTKNTMIPINKEGLLYANQTTEDVWKSPETSEQHAISKSHLDPAPMKPALFEAASAEAELDNLLNSFSDTNFFEPAAAMRKKTSNGFELYQEKTPGKPSTRISSISYTSAEIGKTSNPNNTWNTDDELANLINESSSIANIHDGSSSHEAKESPDGKNSNSNTASKSKLLDDFDSWLDTI